MLKLFKRAITVPFQTVLTPILLGFFLLLENCALDPCANLPNASLFGLDSRFRPRIPDLSPGHGVIFWQNFDRSPLGNYSEQQLKNDWPLKASLARESLQFVTVEEIPEPDFYRVLRVTLKKNEVGEGVYWLFNLPQPFVELYVSYCFRFAKDFDFVRGGKLPGLAGGKANTGGRKPDGLDGWSARIMWRENGKLVQYVYHPDQPSKWGEDFPYSFSAQPGCWYQVETHIKMNTPGRKDGMIESWLNGTKVLFVPNLRFRDIDSLAIDRFLFSTFFGGNTSSWAPPKDETIDFDWFIISQKPISH